MTDDVDTDRVDQTILALLWLNLKVTGAAWRGFDWEAMARRHGRGLISNRSERPTPLNCPQKDLRRPDACLTKCFPATERTFGLQETFHITFDLEPTHVLQPPFPTVQRRTFHHQV